MKPIYMMIYHWNQNENTYGRNDDNITIMSDIKYTRQLEKAKHQTPPNQIIKCSYITDTYKRYFTQSKIFSNQKYHPISYRFVRSPHHLPFISSVCALSECFLCCLMNTKIGVTSRRKLRGIVVYISHIKPSSYV